MLMCVCVRVRVCARTHMLRIALYSRNAHMCGVPVSLCVCVCVCVRACVRACVRVYALRIISMDKRRALQIL